MPARPRELTPDRSARHLFGAKMRAHRERAGITLESLSGIVNISRSHLARIETAEAMPPPTLAPMLDAAFGTDGIFQELYELAKKEIHPDQFQRYMDLEAQAVLIELFGGRVVPGLVQTADYARAQFVVSNPKATQHEIEELVTARLSRQDLLLGAHPAELSLVIDEVVLRRSFGSPKAMHAQLNRLVELTHDPAALLQVLPFTHGGHALMGGSMILITKGNGTKVAYEEGISTGTLFEGVQDVMERQRAYDLLRANALSPRDSAAFIRSVMEELPS